jgi:hypothetical protein
MSTWTDVKAYVKEQLKPGVTNNTSVQKILDSILAVINQAASGSTEPVNNSLWDPDVIYPKDTQPVLYKDEWFVSNIEGNQGIAPMDANGNVHGSWRLVSASSGGVMQYEPRVYTYPLEIVFNTGKLYYLERGIVGPDPFSSVDFATELAEGKWKTLASIYAEDIDFTTGDADNLGRWAATKLKVSDALNKLMDKFVSYLLNKDSNENLYKLPTKTAGTGPYELATTADLPAGIVEAGVTIDSTNLIITIDCKNAAAYKAKLTSSVDGYTIKLINYLQYSRGSVEFGVFTGSTATQDVKLKGLNVNSTSYEYIDIPLHIPTRSAYVVEAYAVGAYSSSEDNQSLLWSVLGASPKIVADPASSGSGGSLSIQDEGTALTAGGTALNFIGTGVSASFDSTNNKYDVTIPGVSGKIRHDTYTALTLAGTMSWDVNNVAEGKAKITIPDAWSGTDIAFSLANAADGFTGILAVYNNDSVSHNLNLPTAGIYAVSEGETASIALAAGSIMELNFAHDGVKIKATKGAFVAI